MKESLLPHRVVHRVTQGPLRPLPKARLCTQHRPSDEAKSHPAGLKQLDTTGSCTGTLVHRDARSHVKPLPGIAFPAPSMGEGQGEGDKPLPNAPIAPRTTNTALGHRPRTFHSNFSLEKDLFGTGCRKSPPLPLLSVRRVSGTPQGSRHQEAKGAPSNVRPDGLVCRD